MFLLQQYHVFWGFGVPGGCKSTSIGKTPYISYITELFGQRVLFFEMGRKVFFITQFWQFLPLKKILIYDFVIFILKQK